MLDLDLYDLDLIYAGVLVQWSMMNDLAGPSHPGTKRLRRLLEQLKQERQDKLRGEGDGGDSASSAT